MNAPRGHKLTRGFKRRTPIGVDRTVILRRKNLMLYPLICHILKRNMRKNFMLSKKMPTKTSCRPRNQLLVHAPVPAKKATRRTLLMM